MGITEELSVASPVKAKLKVVFLCWPAFSHYGAINGLAKELLKKGHSVTFHLPNNCRDWLVRDGLIGGAAPKEGQQAAIFCGSGEFSATADWVHDNVETAKKGAFAGLLDVIGRWRDYRSHYMKHLVPLWEKPENRPDMMIVDVLAYAGYDLNEMYNIPMIVNLPGVYPRAIQNMCWLPPISSGMPIDMRLGQRVGVAIRHALFELLFRRNFAKEMNKVRIEYGLPPVGPNLSFLDCYPSLMNVNFGIDHAHPVSPMQHFVGPMRDLDAYIPVKLELKQWLDGIDVTDSNDDSTDDGKQSRPRSTNQNQPLPVVYVCMGTVTGQTQEQLKSFVEGCSSDKFRVLWSLRREMQSLLPDQLPPNMRIESFLSQVGVLAHPNVKAFITHGGMASMMESIHHGKPLVIVPFMADQMDNAQRATDKGFGIRLNRHKLTGPIIAKALDTVMFDPSYAAAARVSGKIMRSGGGAKQAVKIVEHIADVGCQHLRSHYLDLPVYKQWNLDVFAVFFVFLCVLYFLFRWLVF